MILVAWIMVVWEAPGTAGNVILTMLLQVIEVLIPRVENL
jgi:hypothetical protein